MMTDRTEASRALRVDLFLYPYRAIMGRGVIGPVSMAVRVWAVGLMDAGVDRFPVPVP
jgi:hypothetical protein